MPLTLSEIWIYPIKSLAGIRLSRAQVKPKGLEFDRRFMLVDESGRFLTQREHPEMALFKVSLDQGRMRIGSKSNELIVELRQPDSGKHEQVIIWDDEVEAIEVNPEYSAWFTRQLKLTCRLVFFPEASKRLVDPDYARSTEHVSLADGFPFLIIGESSLRDLNSRLDSPVEMRRFRPNFVFTGGQAFEEDNWKNFRIGANRFLGVKPCGRCVLTTVDPATGIKGKEPLATLSTYRKRGNKILFGQNLLALDYGEVKEGDTITIES